MAIAFTNATKGVGSGATSQTTSAISSAASGSTFVVGIAFDGGVTFTSLADNKSNTFTQIGTELTANSGGKSRLYYCENGAGGAGHTFTATVSGNASISVFAIEITGGKTASILNPAPPAANDDTASPFTSNNITTLQAACGLLTFLASTNSGSASATHTEANGFTVQAAAEETNASANWTGGFATRIVASTGTYSSSWTENGATTGAVWIAAFEEAAGGGGGVTSPQVDRGRTVCRGLGRGLH